MQAPAPSACPVVLQPEIVAIFPLIVRVVQRQTFPQTVFVQQELQEKNAQLLAVMRRLGEDAEADRAALRKELEAESAARAQRLATQITQQREERLRQEVRQFREAPTELGSKGFAVQLCSSGREACSSRCNGRVSLRTDSDCDNSGARGADCAAVEARKKCLQWISLAMVSL